MTPEAWQRIKQISGDAWDRPVEMRAAFLADACAGDAELFREVSSLLASTDAADLLFETPAVAMPGVSEILAAVSRPTRPGPGMHVGSYRLIRELGQGGMGAVYLAERADGAYDQQVAIKFIGTALATSALVERFREERRILAVLSHPNIARMIDGGTTADGLPFVVMEYVPGVLVTDFVVSRQLSIRARLELFRSVCAAVHFAHQRLVIHRDIKAGNILVTDEGMPKLLDFGIATLAEPGQAAESRERTRLRALTPESASPEQLRGEPITIAADIYALGGLLYRLLTGASPYRGPLTSEVELVLAVCEETPLPPSAAAGQPDGNAIDRDLDAIVMKALRKAPERRYGSAEQMSEDISRYLMGLPVRAAPDSRAYRARKFLRRHRALVAIAAAGLIALLTGAGIAAYQATVARRERALAERRFDDVRRLANTVLFEVNDAIANLPGSLSARRLIVTRVADYLDGLAPDAQGHVPLEREMAAAYQRLGDILGGGGVSNLGDFPGAQAAYLKALTLRQALGNGPGATASDIDGLAQLHVDLSRFFGAAGHFDRAEQSAADAVALLESTSGAAAGIDAYLGRLATAYQQLGFTQARNNKRDASMASLERATKLGHQQVDLRPDDPREAVRLARIEADYSEQLLAAARVQEAVTTLEDARARLQHLIEVDPVNTRYRQTLTLVWRDESQSYLQLGDSKRALYALGEAVKLSEALRDADPRDQGAQIGVMMMHYSLGNVEVRSGMKSQGIEHLRQAIGEAEAILNASPANNFVLNELATVHLDLGAELLRQRQGDAEGCRQIAEGLHIWDDLATRAQVPAESGRTRSYFETVLKTCPAAASNVK